MSAGDFRVMSGAASSTLVESMPHAVLLIRKRKHDNTPRQSPMLASSRIGHGCRDSARIREAGGGEWRVIWTRR